ncbi:hypothetical protein V6N13_049747 [Hibiscus sabdariffa]
MGLRCMFMELALFSLVLTIVATSVAAQAKPGCQTHCGNISIPYPFGTGSAADCHINDSFFIRCDTSSDPPRAFLNTTDIEVLHISVDGYLRIRYPIAHDCYTSSGGGDTYLYTGFTLEKFFISHTRNMFTAIGCDTYAYVEGFVGRMYSTGCMSFCYEEADVVNGSCLGIGCCQTALPKGVTDYEISFDSYWNHSKVLSFNPCSYGFAVEDGVYNFSLSHFLDPDFGKKKFPIIHDWTIGNESCTEARMNPQNYACKENSACIVPENGRGYLCKCLHGFQGNPYLSHGCQDINECETLKPCSRICNNLVGSYNCSCPEGFEGDGQREGTGCSPKAKPQFPILAATLGMCISLLFSLLCCSWVYLGVRERKLNKLKQRNFQQNGGILLRERLSEREEYGETSKIFTVEELKKATNNYHESRILGRGGQGTVYKGTLPDGRSVAIKKSIIGLKAVCFERPEHERNLSLYFVSVMQEGRLLDIIDGRVVDDRNIEELKEVATLARRCVRVKGEERPSMKEVASELQGFRATGKFRQEEGDLYEVEFEDLLYVLYNNGTECDCSTGIS